MPSLLLTHIYYRFGTRHDFGNDCIRGQLPTSYGFISKLSPSYKVNDPSFWILCVYVKLKGTIHESAGPLDTLPSV